MELGEVPEELKGIIAEISNIEGIDVGEIITFEEGETNNLAN
jgi:hypothetical protein